MTNNINAKKIITPTWTWICLHETQLQDYYANVGMDMLTLDIVTKLLRQRGHGYAYTGHSYKITTPTWIYIDMVLYFIYLQDFNNDIN